MRQENLRRITELRHELHREPELSMREVGTGEKLRKFLRENTSFEVVERDGWFYAVRYGAASGDGAAPEAGAEPSAGSIAFRADMDALPMEEGIELPYASENPGVSHKCGHDGHCAVLCGVALELDEMYGGPQDAGQAEGTSRAQDSGEPMGRPALHRTVYLIFQKAEEIGCGGQLGAALLREKGISEVYAFHNLSGYPEGAVVYRRGLTQPASEGLTIRFYGKQSHASAPEEGINPAGVIAETVLFIEGMQGRPRRGMALCTITGVRAGNGDFGISAGEGEIMVTLRAEEENVMMEMESEVRYFAGERAAERGIRTEFLVSDRFPETRNSEAGVERVLRAAEALGAPAVEMPRAWRASEDFGHYLKECGGAMFYVGNGREWPAVHTTEYDFNDQVLERAVDLFVEIARSR